MMPTGTAIVALIVTAFFTALVPVVVGGLTGLGRVAFQIDAARGKRHGHLGDEDDNN